MEVLVEFATRDAQYLPVSYWVWVGVAFFLVVFCIGVPLGSDIIASLREYREAKKRKSTV